jgi:hypothetical protein
MIRYAVKIQEDKRSFLVEETLRTDVDGVLRPDASGKPVVVDSKVVLKHVGGGTFASTMASLALNLSKGAKLATMKDHREAYVAARKPKQADEEASGAEFDALYDPTKAIPVKGKDKSAPTSPAPTLPVK